MTERKSRLQTIQNMANKVQDVMYSHYAEKSISFTEMNQMLINISVGISDHIEVLLEMEMRNENRL